ncbi:MAG: FAD-dependent oxidoreductase [Bacillota bacterium]|nr:FAD-dependent oxidoreductase [Bacillota bacterium]
MKLVIAGAGYAGLAVLRTLRASGALRRAHVTLVDPHPFHTLVTRLHGVAAGALPPSRATVPLDRLAGDVELLRARVTGVEPAARRLRTDAGALEYDALVLAAGSVPAYYGIPGLERYSLPLRTLEDALGIRKRLARPKPPARLVVGGAGLTGLELAAEVASRRRRPREIVLVEALPEILPPFSARLREHVKASLARAGVELRTGAPVREVEAGRLRFDGGASLDFDLLVWTGGVAGAPLLRDLGAPLGRGGRLKVDASYAVPGVEGVYAVGDAADDGREPTAQLAIAQGEHLGRLLSLRLLGKREAGAPAAFRLWGVVASLGPRDGFGRLRGSELTGLPAAVMKRLSELRYLWHLGARPEPVEAVPLPSASGQEADRPRESSRTAQMRGR